ncbi:uncharacterized protein DUF3667 [Dysgonomonas alginatilytica]|uniref:Uncharacterized protein DUF3667 n=1 Tax=Dysgonomonas alginatilytica TaxID=1605892 RepID=A0A2V3PU45_9BACT|nr:uncharacterized protein DUF3667 [Dysgonomonas alginatilytica]
MIVKEAYCKNCNTQVTDNYCARCGQPSKTSRIDRHYLLHEIQHSILHVDKGILYTIKELLVRPGYTIERYLDGKRIEHFKPFAFVLMVAAIYSFLVHFFQAYPGETIEVDQTKGLFNSIYSHYSLFLLISIPLFALSSFLVFRKKGYNYIEHLIINSYIVGIRIFISIISYPIYYMFPSVSIFWIINILSICYNIWVLTQLFKTKNWVLTSMKALFSILSVMIFGTFIATVILILFFLK